MRASVSVALAVAAYGVSFGALSVAAGLDVWQTCVLSLLMFSGGSQFALVGVLASGGTAAGPAAIASAALLGMRNSLYSMRMGPIIGGPWWRRLLAAPFTIDESTAVATAQPTLRTQRIGFWVTGLGIYLGWNLTTLAGALRLVYSGTHAWVPPVLTCSALEHRGIDVVWDRILRHREFLGEQGLSDKRARQQLDFMWALVRDELDHRLRTDADVAAVRAALRDDVLAGRLPAVAAADRILQAYDS